MSNMYLSSNISVRSRRNIYYKIIDYYNLPYGASWDVKPSTNAEFELVYAYVTTRTEGCA